MAAELSCLKNGVFLFNEAVISLNDENFVV